jgi:hypothetical protein
MNGTKHDTEAAGVKIHHKGTKNTKGKQIEEKPPRFFLFPFVFFVSVFFVSFVSLW